MAHSKETKLKISQSTKGRTPHNKGKKEEVKHVYYTNGQVSIRIPWNQDPPEGFRRGRLKRKYSDDERRVFVAKVKATKQNRYGDENYNNMSQSQQTKLLRYGQSGYNNREKARQSNLLLYGTDNPAQSATVRVKISQALIGHEVSEETRRKISRTSTGRVPSSESIMKGNQTKRANNSFNTSRAEENLYQQLCNQYSPQDIERNYIDDRYPFKCDFYIKSIDLFIELNRHWTHGGHPFDSSNPSDCETLRRWQEKAKNSKFYEHAIYVWTVLDVRKIEIAKKNHLNYQLIY